MSNRRCLTLHFHSAAAKRVVVDALAADPKLKLVCENGELGDAAWADVRVVDVADLVRGRGSR